MSVPFTVPAVVGANCTSTMQVCPLFNVLGQSSVSLNCALGVMLPMFTVPLALSVIAIGSLVIPLRHRAERQARWIRIEYRKRVDLANEPVLVVGFVDVAGRIDAYAPRLIQFGQCGQNVVAVEAGRSISGDRVNDP